MSRLTVDTSEAMSFEPTEPGPYAMTVDEISDPETFDKGKGVWVYYKFDDPNVHRTCGRVRRVYMIEGKGAGFFREFWKAATGEDIPMDAQIDVDTDDALGRPVMVQIINEPWEGNLQNQAEKVTPRS